ncbi:hypothetical protein GN958_ATG11564 [Phytophthora infestans]|uniref:Uncharacterized protein n=1 Tax=Phytophthora infestans TaxID=4787 RepID=A0A8S9UJQ7_PHYIN|nr:hypothetical protein GN958_ATG11564 [Phytophthora infestans]
MTVDVPLHSTHLVKSRDFVYIEATGTVFLSNGDRVGYHLLHSIDSPQTTPLPNKIRANLLLFGCFWQLKKNVVDNFACATVDPGVDMRCSLLLSVAAGAMLSATNYVYCGQMKKLAWMLQRHHSAYDVERKTRDGKGCVNISFIVVGGKLIQRKVVVCAKCVCELTQWNAQEAARDQITDFEACMSDQGCTSYEACTVSCELSFLESSASIHDR